MIAAFRQLVENSAPYSHLMMAGEGLTFFLVLAVVLLSLRRSWRGGPLALTLAAPLATAAAVVAVGIVGLVRGRASVIGGAFALLGPEAKGAAVGGGITLQMNLIVFGASRVMWTVCYVVAGAAILAVRGARRRGQPAAPALLVIFGLAIVAWTASAAAVAYGATLIESWSRLGDLALEDKAAAAARGLSDALEVLRRWHLILGGALVVATVLALVAGARAARAGRVAGPRAIAAAAAVAVVGLTLFVATRGYAYDAAHPLAVVDFVGLIGGDTITKVPRVRECGEPVEMAPIVDVAEDVRLNGNRVTLAELQEELATSRQDHGRVLVLAAATTPTARLKPLFAAIRAAGMTEIDAAVIVPHDSDTRTLGRLERPSMCRRTPALDALDGRDVAPTWQQLLVNDAL